MEHDNDAIKATIPQSADDITVNVLSWIDATCIHPNSGKCPSNRSATLERDGPFGRFTAQQYRNSPKHACVGQYEIAAH
jgi:hypothetical protein